MMSYKFKKNVCCIPNCNTNGIPQLFFNIPKNFNTCSKWLPLLASNTQIVDIKALVCVRHFNKPDILIKDDGKIVAVDCKAMCTLFNRSTPTALKPTRKRKNSIYYPDYMFYIIDRDAVPVNVNSKYLDSEDFLRDYPTLQSECTTRLEGYNSGWTLNVSQCFLIFFYICENRVKSTVKIDKGLHVEITLSGMLMDPLDVTRWLPPSSRITRWSQLRMILVHFGMETQNFITPAVNFEKLIRKNDQQVFVPKIKYL